jgi:hypothetical protein
MRKRNAGMQHEMNHVRGNQRLPGQGGGGASQFFRGGGGGSRGNAVNDVHAEHDRDTPSAFRNGV